MTVDELIEGVVVAVDKPRQWSSFQAVNKVKAVIRHRYGLKKFKIGHAGTLDPLATGLLLVCVGKATKRIEELQAGEKVYSGTMVLGATTPCFDLEQAVDTYFPYRHITPELVAEVLPQFRGEIEQMPPIFSAVKIDGQRAYKYAREGDAPEPQPKRVTVYEFEVTAFRPGNESGGCDGVCGGVSASSLECEVQTLPGTQLYRNPQGSVPPFLPQIDFRIRCSKGTYIRSLARDLGFALGSGAFLSALCREQVGDYRLADACQMEDIANIFA